jgi:hypothetical protein
MKVITVAEAEGRLPQILDEVMQGEYIVLKNGDKEVGLTRRIPGEIDLEEDSPELEAELLKSADQIPTPFSSKELREIGRRLIREHRQK